ncbi:conserved protein of unknown function [Streptantibioticus cattleyicolor NRRL 8057 = DSM 46488]|nr:conserved protein of unknown function [Streptantibioticus cattleyicolor NRRL 8057 = DSM 46488]
MAQVTRIPLQSSRRALPRVREAVPAMNTAATEPMTSRQRQSPTGTLPQPGIVPYITRWSAEQPPPTRVIAKGRRLAYADERPYDRDTSGVLWTRVPSLPGKGKPRLGAVHALRQRRAMEELLCQVCAEPSDRNQDGVLWLLGEDLAAHSAHDRFGLTTTHPPVCAPCAPRSVRACPHLRQRHVTLRVRSCEPVGVRGALYRPGFPDPAFVDVAGVAFTDPRIHWIRAGQLITALRDFTVQELPPRPQHRLNTDHPDLPSHPPPSRSAERNRTGARRGVPAATQRTGGKPTTKRGARRHPGGPPDPRQTERIPHCTSTATGGRAGKSP